MQFKHTNPSGKCQLTYLCAEHEEPIFQVFAQRATVQKIELTTRSGFIDTYERETSPSADSG